jgi:hypothetical protein
VFGFEEKLERQKYVRASLRREKKSRFDVLFGIRERIEK